VSVSGTTRKALGGATFATAILGIRDPDGFQIPPATPYAGGKAGTAKSRILITHVVEKEKARPLGSPA
jgi:hypothetical protein